MFFCETFCLIAVLLPINVFEPIFTFPLIVTEVAICVLSPIIDPCSIRLLLFSDYCVISVATTTTTRYDYDYYY